MAALVSIYLGCGCFWHIQHELIQAERSILSRTDDELTSLAGYAGGTGTNSIGRACYPYSNRALGDHQLHHTEVVGLQIPRDSFSDFAEEYWRLFVGINRVDVQDVGPEYRAVIGLPGGMSSDLLAEIDAAQTGIAVQTFELRAGVGGDADTLGQALVWVYDTDEFPFYQAEMYHQFHDDMVERYPQAYNDLNGLFGSDCRMVSTGCSNDPITQADGCPEVATVEGAYSVQSSPPASSDGGSGGGSSQLDDDDEGTAPSLAAASGQGESDDADGSAAPSPSPASSIGESSNTDGADNAAASGADDLENRRDSSATSQLPTAWLANAVVLCALIARTSS